jgi:hypothetical protein
MNFLRFSTQFTKISKSANTIEVILLRGGPGKIQPFAMWPLAMAGGAGRPNSGEPLAGAGRARAGEGPWVLGDRFRGSVVEGEGSTRWGTGGQAR